MLPDRIASRFGFAALPLILFVALNVYNAYAVCTEPGNFLVCEDWDAGTPPTCSPTTCSGSSACCPTGTWPWRGGPAWNGWVPQNYGTGQCGELTTARAHSAPRSLLQKKRVGSTDTVDLRYAFPDSKVIHIRFYLYLPRATATAIGGPGQHFIFLEMMNAAECTLDFQVCGEQVGSNYYDCDIGNLLLVHSYNPEIMIANNMAPRGSRKYFYLRDHPDEWILVEWRVDLNNNTTSLWINEIQQINNYPIDFSFSSAGQIEISGFTLNTSNAFEYYIDDFVVSTSYIGPRRESEVDTSAPTTSGHSPAKNATGVPANTNISLHVLDSGDGVNRSSIVMTVNGQTVTPTITGSPADYTVSYNPPVDFSPGQTVTVTLDASDLHNPPNVMPKESYSFTVAADTKPPAAPKSLRVNVQ
jgi:hypothetical protein